MRYKVGDKTSQLRVTKVYEIEIKIKMKKVNNYPKISIICKLSYYVTMLLFFFFLINFFFQ